MTTETATAERTAAEQAPTATILPPEDLQEIREASALVTIDEQVSRSAADALKRHEELVKSTIKLTYPEDWVLYDVADGVKLGYLQDVGCQRIRAPWGIRFEALNLLRDVLEEKIGGDAENGIAFTVLIRGLSTLSGQEIDGIGYRQSATGLWANAWTNAADNPAERDLIRSDVRKASIANAKGRVVRELTGMNSMPVEVLRAAGLNVARCRGVRFEGGAKGGRSGGGSGSMASESQCNYIANLASKQKKVAGAPSVAVLKQALVDAGITKKDASAAIERLKDVNPGAVSLADLVKFTGIELPEPDPEPGSEG